MSTPYTPGPWCVRNGSDIFTALGATTGDGWKAADNDGWHIADCRPETPTTDDIGFDCGLSSGEVMANAALIAAAPDMYEALVLALKALNSISDEMTLGERYTNAGQYLVDALMPVKDAITKARGGQ